MLNKATSHCGGATLDDFTDSNKTGRFRRKAQGRDPFGNPKRHIWGYFITTPGGLVERPPDGKMSLLSLLQDLTINDCYSVARGLPDIIDLTSSIQEEQSAAKRKAEEKALAEENANKKPKHTSGSASSRVVEESY